MSKEKEVEIRNINEQEVVQELIKNRNKILEAFTKAYLAETQLMPSQIELVTRQMPIKDGIIENIFFFRKRTSEKQCQD